MLEAIKICRFSFEQLTCYAYILENLLHSLHLFPKSTGQAAWRVKGFILPSLCKLFQYRADPASGKAETPNLGNTVAPPIPTSVS